MREMVCRRFKTTGFVFHMQVHFIRLKVIYDISSSLSFLYLYFKDRNMSDLCRWLFPIIGHMGICTSAGIIRDFAGPYCVGEDKMAFGNPTRYAISIKICFTVKNT